MLCKETVYYLEMTDSGQLIPPRGLVKDLEIRKLGRPMPEMNRFFYMTIGKDWAWTERLPWNHERWLAYLTQPGMETWLALNAWTPAGYFELLPDPSTGVEIAMFGLLAPFTGQGLGSHLLSFAVHRAWALGTHRVWLHMSSLDHPCALAHYQARGFTLTHAVEMDKAMPGSAPNAWGEYPSSDSFAAGEGAAAIPGMEKKP